MKIEYNNLYTHFVFTTLLRRPIITEKNRILEKYITGIVNNNSSKLYAIYANPEHMHFLVSRSPDISEIELANIIAESSKRFINANIYIEQGRNKLSRNNFAWQPFSSAFSVSKSDADPARAGCKYILGQPEHHKKMSFAEEYDLFIQHYQQNIKKIR
ncbi:MAG: transposase [Bacteroidales bacterium]|jgi:putative transposase|nr:transposase [Bacteroidales bacterium]